MSDLSILQHRIMGEIRFLVDEAEQPEIVKVTRLLIAKGETAAIVIDVANFNGSISDPGDQEAIIENGNTFALLADAVEEYNLDDFNPAEWAEYLTNECDCEECSAA